MRATNVLVAAAALSIVSVAAPRDGHCSATGRTAARGQALILTVAATSAAAGTWKEPCGLVAQAGDAGQDPVRRLAKLPRQETTAQHRIYEAEHVSREVPDSALGKPLMAVSIADSSGLQMRVGPACKSLTRAGFAVAGRF